MPNTAQSAKRARQNVTAHLRNRDNLSMLRTQIKRFQAAIQARNVEVAEREYRLVTKLLDKNAKTHLIHKNTADRKKSRLAKQLHSARQELAGKK